MVGIGFLNINKKKTTTEEYIHPCSYKYELYITNSNSDFNNISSTGHLLKRTNEFKIIVRKPALIPRVGNLLIL